MFGHGALARPNRGLRCGGGARCRKRGRLRRLQLRLVKFAEWRLRGPPPKAFDALAAKASPTAKNPDAVEHSALIYGISGSGKITTVYPSNFKPSEIVHDVPLLASS